MNYPNTRKQADMFGDVNACSMIAISLTTNTPYHEVRARCVEAGLWDANRGRWTKRTSRSQNSWHSMLKLFPEVGFDSRVLRPTRGRSRVSFKTIGRMYPKGNYIIRSRGHAAALIDGKVEDWSEGHRHMTIEVFPVTPRVIEELPKQRGLLTLKGVVPRT